MRDRSRERCSLSGWRVLLMGGVYFLVACTWGLVVPLFAGPDEPGHFIKGAAVIRGELIGRDVPITAAGEDYWATSVTLDRRFVNANSAASCFASHSNQPACPFDLNTGPSSDGLVYTNVGRYPPPAYAVYGLGSLLGPRNTAVHLARLLNALICSVLFACAAWSIRDRRRYAYLALLVAVPPGTSFMSSIVNPSGPELVAAVALWLASGRLFASDEDGIRLRFDRGDRLAWVTAGVTLCASRALGPLFAVAIVGFAAVASNLDARELKSRCRRVWPHTSAIVLIGIANVLWYVTVFNTRTHVSAVAGAPSLNFASRTIRTLGHIPVLISEMVGNFGWLDTPAPTLVVWAWTTAGAGIVVIAVSRGTDRLRVAMGATVVAAMALLVLGEEQANVLSRQLWTQGRHLEPLLLGLVLLPVFAPSQPLAPLARYVRHATVVSASLVGICQLHALRRYTIGLDNFSLVAVVRHPVWQPVITVWPTVILVALGLWLTIAAWPGNTIASAVGSRAP